MNKTAQSFTNLALFLLTLGFWLLSSNHSALARSYWWHPMGTVWGDSWKPDSESRIYSQTGANGSSRTVIVSTRRWGGCSSDMQGCTNGFKVKDNDSDSVYGTATSPDNVFVSTAIYGMQVAEHKAFGANYWTTGYTSYESSANATTACFHGGQGHPNC